MPFPLAEVSDRTWSILQGSIGLLVLIVVLFLAVIALRRWMRSDAPAAGSGFTLSDLRQLHKSGQMSTEEFEKAKSILVGAAKAQASKPAPKATRPPT